MPKLVIFAWSLQIVERCLFLSKQTSPVKLLSQKVKRLTSGRSGLNDISESLNQNSTQSLQNLVLFQWHN